MSSSQQQRVAGSSAAAAAATPPPPPQGVKAVNLRDIGEIDPNRLRKGVLYRCSQIYTPEVLKDLKVCCVWVGGARGGGVRRCGETCLEGEEGACATRCVCACYAFVVAVRINTSQPAHTCMH